MGMPGPSGKPFQSVKAGNIKSMGITSEGSSEGRLVRRSPRNRVVEVVIFLSAYKC